jgi:hypothetical protein
LKLRFFVCDVGIGFRLDAGDDVQRFTEARGVIHLGFPVQSLRDMALQRQRIAQTGLNGMSLVARGGRRILGIVMERRVGDPARIVRIVHRVNAMVAGATE